MDLIPDEKLLKRLSAARAEAEDRDDVVAIQIGSEKFLMRSHGVRGKKFVFGNDDAIVMMGTAKQDWPTSIRLTSAGIWEHGVHDLINRITTQLVAAGAYFNPENKGNRGRVSRADYCFDFHSPAFTQEMEPEILRRVVAHSSCKVSSWGNSARMQTITIGSRSGVQVQAYNKSDEIREINGKAWFYELWGADEDGVVFDKDVWRVEVRFGRDFLADRNLRTEGALMDAREKLVAEALYTRRVMVPQEGDTNRWRCPLHPLWSEAIRNAGADCMVPLGRITTGKRSHIYEQLAKQVAGTALAAQVVELDAYRPDELPRFFNEVEKIIREDGKRSKKVERARDRYLFIDEAS